MEKKEGRNFRQFMFYPSWLILIYKTTTCLKYHSSNLSVKHYPRVTDMFACCQMFSDISFIFRACFVKCFYWNPSTTKDVKVVVVAVRSSPIFHAWQLQWEGKLFQLSFLVAGEESAAIQQFPRSKMLGWLCNPILVSGLLVHRFIYCLLNVY